MSLMNALCGKVRVASLRAIVPCLLAAASSLTPPFAATAQAAPVRSADVTNALLKIVHGPGSQVMNWFLDHGVDGGWEIWLQVELANDLLAQIAANHNLAGVTYSREKQYPGGHCTDHYDFYLTQGSNPGVLGEIKAQRRTNSAAATIQAFISDGKKFSDCLTDVKARDNYIYMAAAIWKPTDNKDDLWTESMIRGKLNGAVKLYHIADDGSTQQIQSPQAGWKILAIFVYGVYN